METENVKLLLLFIQEQILGESKMSQGLNASVSPCVDCDRQKKGQSMILCRETCEKLAHWQKLHAEARLSVGERGFSRSDFYDTVTYIVHS